MNIVLRKVHVYKNALKIHDLRFAETIAKSGNLRSTNLTNNISL